MMELTLEQRVSRLERAVSEMQPKSEQWVGPTVITKLTGWNSEQMRAARRNGSVKYKRSGSHGFKYLISSIIRSETLEDSKMSIEKRLEAIEKKLDRLLIKVEEFLQVNNSDTWVNEETALRLLGCKKTKLFQLKASGDIKYKKVGRQNQYSRASIDKYNLKYSS